MSLVASLTAYGWGQPEGEEKSFSFSEKEKSFSFGETFEENQLLSMAAPAHSFPFAQPLKQPSHSHLPLPVGQLTFPNRLVTRQNSMKCASYGSIAQPEELLGELSDWDFGSDAGNPLSRTGTQRDLSMFSSAILSRMNSKALFSRQNSEVWNTDVKVDRLPNSEVWNTDVKIDRLPNSEVWNTDVKIDRLPSQAFALNSPPPKDMQVHPEAVPALGGVCQIPKLEVKTEPDHVPHMDEDQDDIKAEEYGSEASCSSPAGRDGAPNGKAPPTRSRDMGIRRVKQQCYRDLKKSCEIQLTRLVPPSSKHRSKRDFNTLLRDVIAKVRAVAGSGAGGAAMPSAGSRRRGSVVSTAEQNHASSPQDEAAKRHREALLSSEMCGIARVDSENWTIVEANAQMARILHVAPGNHDGVRRDGDDIRATNGARLLKGKTLFDIVHPHSTPRLVRACNALMRTVGDQNSPCKTRVAGMLSLQHDARLDCVPKLATSHQPDETPPVEMCNLELVVCPASPSLAASSYPDARRCTLLLIARPQNPSLPGTPTV